MMTFEKYGDSDEIRLILDRYDIQTSLKRATCLERQGQQDLTYYLFTPCTLVTKIIMKKLLSHTSTMDELAKYLVEQTIEYAERNEARAKVVYGCECVVRFK